MKELWLLGILWMCLASAKAPDPQIPGSSLRKMKDIAEAARMKYIEGKGLNEGLPLTKVDGNTSIKKAPVSARFTISKIAKTATGITLTIVSENNVAIPEVAFVGLGIVTGNNNDFASEYDQVPSTGGFSSPSEVEFTYDISKLEENYLTLFAVTGRTATDEVVAAGSVSFNAIDITPSRVDRVGADNDGDIAIRLAYPQSFMAGIIVNAGTGDLCTCTEYPCYCVGLNMADTVAEICTELTSLEDSSINFKLCDSTVTQNDFFGSIIVTSASLTHTKPTEAKLDIACTYDNAHTTVEIVYYEASAVKAVFPSVECTMTNNLCTALITDIKETDIDNRILVVSKGISGAVTGSQIYDFEDYKVKLYQLSGTAAEVSWATTAPGDFEIILDGSQRATAQCTGTVCKAYVNGLTANPGYTVSVQKSGEKNSVGSEGQLTGTGVSPLTIDKLLKKVGDTGDGKTTVEVTVFGTIQDISDVTLGLLVDSGTTVTEYIYQVGGITEIITSTPVEFPVDTVALTGVSHTVIVATHGTNNVPTAAGEVTVTLQALIVVMDFVGVLDTGAPLSSLRVKADVGVIVAETTCDAGQTKYILGAHAPDTDPVEVCDSTISPPTSVCDVTIPVNPFQGPIVVTNVTITSNKDETAASIFVGGTYITASKNMDIVVYEEDTEIYIKNCIIQETPTPYCQAAFDRTGLTNKFQLLLVAQKDDDSVAESHAINFEDYRTTVQQLTTDLIEVRWSAASNAVYQISLNKDVPDAYNQVTVTCGDTSSDKCKAYFMMLKTGEYIARVKLDDVTGDINIVAATVEMTALGVGALSITSVALEDQGSTSLAKVCFDQISPLKSGEEPLYEFTMIDRSGRILSSVSNSTEDGLCVGNLIIDSNFDTSAQVRILVSTVVNDNREVGDADLYLLDSNTQDSIAYVSVKQVGQTTLRATWTNLNDASSYHISPSNESVVCGHKQQCGRYIEFSSTATSPVTITITEIGDIVQTLSFDVAITKDITPITISSISMRWDDRVQVCFIAPAEVSTYELGLQVSNELLQSTQSPQLVSGDNGTSCLVSEKTVEVGAYIELWSLVSAFGTSGNLLASGSKVLKSIILSASRSVYGAVMDSTFLTTWHLLDNIKDIDHIKVTLLALESQGTRVIDTVNVTAAATSHDFGIQPEGKYSICVVAVKGGITSEEICSDIIRVHNTAVEVPLVRATSPKTTSENSVLVTWEPPQEEVSGFFISWNKVPVLLSLRESIKDGYKPRAKDGAIHPLDLMNFAKASSRATGTGFTIVASSETSFEVQDLESNQNYITCVFSVKDDVVGTQNCSDIDLADYEPLENPTNLIYENGDLTWTGDELAMHRVECQSRTDKRLSIFREINGTKCQLDLEPGEWDIEVRAFTDLSFSEATRITNTVKGLVVTAKQTEQTSLVVSWYEQNFVAPAVPDMTMPLYEVLLQRNGDIIAGPVPVYCSGSLIDCHHEFQNLTVSSTDTVKVTVQPRTTTTSNKTSEFTFDEITGITMLTKNVRSSDEVEVTWEEVPQAKKYLYTIYDTEVLNNTIEQGYIPETTKTLTMPNITGYWLTVQGCTDEQHCGNLAIIPLNQGSGNTNDNKTTIIIAATISSVVGVGLLLVIVAVVMRKKKRRGGKGESGKEGNEPKYDKWGARTLGQPKEKRGSPEDLPRSPSSRQNYGIPSTFNVHS